MQSYIYIPPKVHIVYYYFVLLINNYCKMLINNLLFCDRGLHYYNFIIHVLMRDERRKEERSKQGQ